MFFLLHGVAKYRLRPRIRFDSEVLAAAFDEAAGLWRVSLGTGEVLSAQALQRQGLRYLAVKPAVQRRYNQRIQAGIHQTIWDQCCSSWYKAAAGKHTNNWPGYTFTYRRLTRAAELSDYECIR